MEKEIKEKLIEEDLYKVLGVEKEAEEKEIQKMYKKVNIV
jgi:DnaJ-class molecular chaperone